VAVAIVRISFPLQRSRPPPEAVAPARCSPLAGGLLAGMLQRRARLPNRDGRKLPLNRSAHSPTLAAALA
jgi:hypothetical protein